VLILVLMEMVSTGVEFEKPCMLDACLTDLIVELYSISRDRSINTINIETGEVLNKHKAAHEYGFNSGCK
jgi:hypothetical protein